MDRSTFLKRGLGLTIVPFLPLPRGPVPEALPEPEPVVLGRSNAPLSMTAATGLSLITISATSAAREGQVLSFGGRRVKLGKQVTAWPWDDAATYEVFPTE